MVTAIEYRAMALQHHRWAGMCRSPESREEHFRLEKELLALADNEERLHGCVRTGVFRMLRTCPFHPLGPRADDA